MKNYQVALQSIIDNYDAFYIGNKYRNGGTHKKEFELLETLASSDNKVKNALAWIKYNYDCYYKEECIAVKIIPLLI